MMNALLPNILLRGFFPWPITRVMAVRGLLLTVFILCLALPAFAAETGMKTTGAAKKKNEGTPYVYAPEDCDFQVTFPDTPGTARRCPPGTNKCYAVTSYTMVFDLHTTIDVSVTCTPSTEANSERYSEKVMRTALQGMVARTGITDYNINFDDSDGIRQATLTGTGSVGRQGKIYTAQIWAGPTSVFTVQAELVGGAHPKADPLFRDILQSMKLKEEPPPEKEEEKEDEDDAEDKEKAED